MIYCDKCDKAILKNNQGAKIVTGVGKHIFCRICLKGAFKTLVIKPQKTTQEIELLVQIRKWLKEPSN